MKKVFAVYKKVGETPLETLNRVKESFPYLKEEKLSYAGRLDPLAQGVMVVLVGDANKERDKYLNLNKTYYFDVIFEVESDSYDPLGIVKEGPSLTSDNINNVLRDMTYNWRGEMNQKYPPFSSKTVDGKPLFEWAKKGIEVERPYLVININNFVFLGSLYLPLSKVVKNAMEKINLVKGDFRQGEVLDSWMSFEKKFKKDLVYLARFKIDVSSGTYVRSLAKNMGLYCNTSALAFHIFRTKVGYFSLKDTLM